MNESRIVKYGVAHGRFQPPHNEHLEYLLSAKRHCSTLIVAVTNPVLTTVEETRLSPHRHSQDTNPFTYLDRQIMLRDCLLDAGICASQFLIVPFDLFSVNQWKSYLPDSSNVEFLVRVFSDWERSKIELFNQNGYAVRQIDCGVTKSMTATDVRERLSEGGDWLNLVPRATARFIENRLGG